jgi:hypothetical protein
MPTREHIKRAHEPLILRQDGKHVKCEAPRIGDVSAYLKWKEQENKRSGKGLTDDQTAQIWWQIAKALNLVNDLPQPLPRGGEIKILGIM